MQQVWLCPNDRTGHWSVAELEQWMLTKDTDQDIVINFCKGLLNWRNQVPTRPNIESNSLNQDMLGWEYGMG